MKQVKSLGSFEGGVPVFKIGDLYDAMEDIDKAIVGDRFYSVLLTCSSPHDILDEFSDEPVSEFGYISEEIVNDTAEDLIVGLEGYVSNIIFNMEFSRVFNKVVTSAKSKNKALVLFYEEVAVESVSETQLGQEKKKGFLRLFKR